MATIENAAMAPAATPTVHCETEVPGGFPQRLRVRSHTFRADMGRPCGGDSSLSRSTYSVSMYGTGIVLMGLAEPAAVMTGR